MVNVIRMTLLGLAMTIAMTGCSSDPPAPPPAASEVNSSDDQGSGDKGSDTSKQTPEPVKGSGSSN